MLKTIPTIGEQPWIKLTVEWKMKMKVKIKIKTKNAKENVNDDGKKQMQIKVAEPCTSDSVLHSHVMFKCIECRDPTKTEPGIQFQ